MSVVADAPIDTVPVATVPDRAAGVARARLVEVAAVAMVFAVSAAVFATRVARPFPWTDEAATTLVVSRRSWSQLALLWQGIDAPHVPYYLLAKAWWGMWSWLGLSPLVTVRLLSVVAMSAAVAGVYLLARREVGVLAGVLAAAFVVMLPGVSRQAQDARPYAVLALAVAASWLAWSWWRAAPPRQRHTRSLMWAATMVVAVAVSPFGVLAVIGQLVAQLWLGSGRDRAAALAVVGAALLVATPQLAVSLFFGRGTEQAVAFTVDNLVRTSATVLANAPDFGSVTPVLALAGLGLLVLATRGERLAAHRRLAAMAATWLGVGLVGGLALAVARPQLLLARYWTPLAAPVAVLAALAAAALITVAGGGTSRWRPAVSALAAAVVAAVLAGQGWLAMPAHDAMRTRNGHLSLGNAISVANGFHRAHRQAPILITAASRQAVFWVTRPDLAARNPLFVIDDNSVSVWPVARPDAEVVAALAGQPEVLWLSPPHNAADLANLPAGLVAHGVSVVSQRSIRSWDVAVVAIP